MHNLLKTHSKSLLICIYVFIQYNLLYACDDHGVWARSLVSKSSNSTTYFLGGIFPIHHSAPAFEPDPEKNDSIDLLKCDCTYQESVFLAEAMIYAIDQINRRQDLLPDIRLGYSILGSCDIVSENAYFALEEYSLSEMYALNLSYTEYSGDNFLENPLMAVIGPSSSDGGTSMADILKSYGIPIISYGATVTDLTKRSRFPTLFRTVFSDDKQVEALADLCVAFNWTYVAAVGSDDDLGREGVAAFKRIMNRKGGCLSSEAYFDADTDDSRLYSIIENLKNKKKEGAVVDVALLFMEWPYAYKFLKVANSLQLANITWLGVDHWTSDIGMTFMMPDEYLPAPYTKGTVSTQFSSNYIHQFAQYLEKNLPERMRENEWLMRFFCDQCNPGFVAGEANATCTLETATSYGCMSRVHLSDILKRQRRIPNVFSAVYAAAHALDNVLKQRDPVDHHVDHGQHVLDHPNQHGQHSSDHSNTTHGPRHFDIDWPSVDYDKLIDSLSTVDFTYTVGMYRSPRISFRPEGDLNDASFEIVNFYQSDPSEWYLPSREQRVGLWTGNITVNTSRIHWQTELGSSRPPMSYCHRPCGPGEKLVRGPSACCWSCEPCPASTCSDTYNSEQCHPCEPHSYSSHNGTSCTANTRIWIGYSDPIAVICITLCVIGELFTLIAAVICCATNNQNGDGGYAMKTVVFVNFSIAYTYGMIIFAQPTAQSCIVRMIVWQTLSTANLISTFFMLTQGRKVATRLARILGLAPTPTATRPRSDSTPIPMTFLFKWRCEICFMLVMILITSAYVITAVFVPPTVSEEDLYPKDMGDSESQSTNTMLTCSSNIYVTAVTLLILCGLWILNLVNSTTLYRRARRRRDSCASNLTAGQSMTKRSPVEFHASNILWSGYLVVLVLTVVVPLYVTTDDPWSRIVFRAYTPFVIITLLLGVFAVPRCWHALKNACSNTQDAHDDVFGPAPFIISNANNFPLRKMSTILEDESTEF